MPATQRSLLCGCGASTLFARGRCSHCYRAWRLSRERFAGLRQSALRRDGGCVLCGACASLVVHHRLPGQNELHRLAVLCRACHVRVHFVPRLRFGASPHFRLLWRELHREELEQLELPFFAPAEEMVQAALFAAA